MRPQRPCAPKQKQTPKHRTYESGPWHMGATVFPTPGISTSAGVTLERPCLRRCKNGILTIRTLRILTFRAGKVYRIRMAAPRFFR